MTSPPIVEGSQLKLWVAGSLLVAATLLLYAPVIHHPFLVFFDDDFYVTKNVHVNTGLNRENIVWAFASFYEANWHPLTWLSHMTDCQVFGLSPGPHHFVNAALHSINVLFLFLLLRAATGALWRSLFVAALFAAHPLNVETVAWVAERKSLVCTFFSLLTIAAYGWYVRHPHWKNYLAIVVAFSLALMSKPMAVSLPFALLLLDYWPLQRGGDSPREWVRLAIEKLPLFLLSAASCVITVLAQRSVGAMADPDELPLLFRLQNAAVSYVAYLGKIFWPARLSVFYPHPGHSLSWPDVVASTVILATITVAVSYFRRTRYLLVGWSVFVVSLIPVAGIVQVGRQAMADRYAYVPAIGLFIIVAWGLGSLVDAIAIPRVVAGVAATCLLLALGAATRHYLQYWQSGAELFTQARSVAGQPDFIIEEGLAENLAVSGRSDEAFFHYREACRLRPNYARCHYKMAELLHDRHQLQEALQEYDLVARRASSNDIRLLGLIHGGEILLDLGEYEHAATNFTEALQIDPNNREASRMLQQALDEKKGNGH